MARHINVETVARAQRALTRNLGALLDDGVLRPHAGWLRATRDALGMSRAQMAGRMGITRARIAQLEQSEKEETIKLDTLRRAADALNCTLVYAFVPNEPYDQIMSDQARARAGEQVAQVTQTMRLEGQTPSESVRTQAQIEAERRLIESGRLWDL
jgi:predicted DNA-binding mobile mystery protein A